MCEKKHFTREEVVSYLKQAHDVGTLVSPKHNPEKIEEEIYSSFRSVISHDVYEKIEWLLNEGCFDMVEYRNISRPNSPCYISIQPNDGSGFSVAASGIEPNSTTPSSTMDCLVAVSGDFQGWHIYGENSHNIERKMEIGELDFMRIL